MRPNILMFFTDQLRFDALAAHGNPNIKTPNIDRLINSGVSFTKAYTPSPVCVAARCSMHYGQYPTKTGCWSNGRMPTDERKSYADYLSESGYKTHAIGKCHFTPDLYALRGFQSREYQEEMGFSDMSKEDYLNFIIERGYGYAIEPHGIRSEMYYVPQPSRLPQELHPTQWIGDRTINFIENQTKDQPWFLFSSFIHPHPPFAPPSPWHTLYHAVDMEMPNVPDDAEELQIFINKLQNRYKYRDRGIDINLVRTMKAYYYACVSFIDYQVGRVLDALEKSGQAENTVIIFTADHGEMLGDYNCFGKRSMHNAAARIPMIICGDVFKGGIKCDTPVSNVDMAPTVLKIAGANSDGNNFDGVELQSVFSGKCDRKGVYSFFSAEAEIRGMYGKDVFDSLKTPEEKFFAGMNMMYVEKDYKYIYSAPDDKEILFNEKDDPKETKNYINAPECAEVVKNMRNKLIEHLKKEKFSAIIDGDKFKPVMRLEPKKDPDSGLIRQDFKPKWFDFSSIKDYQ